MGYWTYTTAPIGNFIEKDHGKNFEYSLNNEQDEYSKSIAQDYPHKVWVGSLQIGGDSGWRYARVLKTVCYIVTGDCEEEEDGTPIPTKWEIKNHTNYNTEEK
tara:strand:- start:46 stop:354 length:309 start_codon:yes stop_codon:yes gene_type:complete